MNEILKFIEKIKDVSNKNALSRIRKLERRYDFEATDEIKFFWERCMSIRFGHSGNYVSPVADYEYFTETIDGLFFNFEDPDDYEEESAWPAPSEPFSCHKKWIPFISADMLFYFFDFNPIANGKRGQIISSDMMGGEYQAKFIANGLNEVIGRINREIEKGNISMIDDNGNISLISSDGKYDLFAKIGL